MKASHCSLAALFVIAGFGCASSPPPAAQAPTGETPVDEASACESYAAQMCEMFGARSRSCEAVQRVGRWIAPSACVVALRDLAVTTTRVAALRGGCDEVGKRLCQKPEVNGEVCSGLTADLQLVPPEDCASLIEAYPEVEQAFMERLSAEEPLDPALQAELLAGDPPAFGPSDAAVQVVLFSDFQCPYCSRVAPVLERLRSEYGDRVHLVFRQFPLSFHGDAHKAAEAALFAHAQGKFWPFHDQLFAHQSALGVDAIVSYAKDLELSADALKKALDEGTYAAAVDADLALGGRAHVRGTPTMLVNGQPVDNPLDPDAVAASINALLSQGGEPSAVAGAPSQAKSAAEAAPAKKATP